MRDQLKPRRQIAEMGLSLSIPEVTMCELQLCLILQLFWCHFLDLLEHALGVIQDMWELLNMFEEPQEVQHMLDLVDLSMRADQFAKLCLIGAPLCELAKPGAESTSDLNVFGLGFWRDG